MCRGDFIITNWIFISCWSLVSLKDMTVGLQLAKLGWNKYVLEQRSLPVLTARILENSYSYSPSVGRRTSP